MNNKKQFGFLIILSVAAFATLAVVILPTLKMGNKQANTNIQQVVQDFYNWYLSYDGNPLVDHVYRGSRHLTPEMVAFLDDFTQNGMAYDPVLCAQDKPGAINVLQPQISGNQASVTVKTDFESHEFSVELAQVDGNWLIDKVTCRP